MLSTGNDIVDLRLTDTDRTNQSRFFSKILSPSEQQSAPPDLPFEKYVWLLWTIKESAYKYFKRLIPDLAFSPPRIVIDQLNFPGIVFNFSSQNEFCEKDIPQNTFYFGKASLVHGSVFFRSIITEELIATVVDADPDFTKTHWGIKVCEDPDAENLSAEVRAFSLKRLNSILSTANLRFEKSEIGYPILLNQNEELIDAVSFAHHGRFVAYCFKLR